ncbi:MAG: hypothetical protein OEX18_14805 [Candidatus Krumholzibacteria bacterium]|nr:hypothetical protein [Candidatus Krumholzibacteria bacterium]MDH4338538.1 hypothetical protein [Candidatus Krumholzibacteria bacterium]
MTTRVYLLSITACLITFTAAAGCSAQSNPPPTNPWTVVAVRERRAGEVPFEERSSYLWPTPDPNNVPGPDSLIARVESDEQLHSFIDIEDLRTGESHRLIDANAFLPHWSPDGRYLGCEVWKSPGQLSELTVVDVATRSVIIDPEIGASAGQMKWSPDSRILAADGVIYGRPRTMLYAVKIPEGLVIPLDTLQVLGDYEFSWSPDGQWIAFSRATRLDRHGDHPIAADLWIADTQSGRKWPLLETTDWVETNPLWITDGSLQIDRSHVDGGSLGPKQRVVIELSILKGGSGRSP